MIENLWRIFNGRISYIQCDVSVPQEFEMCLTTAKALHGHIDVLINNAGILNEVHWSRMIDVNLKGAINGIRLGLKFMSKLSGGRGGKIINLSSAAGVKPCPGIPAYSATKAGILAYVHSLQGTEDFEENGVLISSICPTTTDTNMVRNLKRSDLEFEDFMLILMDQKEEGLQHVDRIAGKIAEMLQDMDNFKTKVGLCTPGDFHVYNPFCTGYGCHDS